MTDQWTMSLKGLEVFAWHGVYEAERELGQRFIVDDPHNTKSAESDAERQTACSWFTEATPTRFTDPKHPVYVIIMQRLHVGDISGVVIEKLLEKQNWTHLCLPMEFEEKYRCYSVVRPPWGGEPVRMSKVKNDEDPVKARIL